MDTTVKAIQILVTADHFDKPLYQIMQYHKTIDDVWESLEEKNDYIEMEFVTEVEKTSERILLPLEEEIMERIDPNLSFEIRQLFSAPYPLNKKVSMTIEAMRKLDFREKYIFILLFTYVLDELEMDEIVSFLDALASMDEELAAIFVSSEYFRRRIFPSQTW